MRPFKYQPELEFAKTIVLNAGKMGSDFANRLSVQVSLKADYSAVTEADIALSDYLVKELTNQYPSDTIISEEIPFTKQTKAPHRAWTIDPIDGTKEFIQKNGQWAVQLAFLVEGRPEFGIVFQPTLGRMYFNDGTTSYIQENGATHPIQVTVFDSNKSTLLISNSRMDALVFLSLEKKLFKNTIRRGSIGLKAGAIANAEADFYMNSFRKCGIWDLAPCEPILKKGGGTLCAFDGSEIDYLKSTNGLVEVDFVMGSSEAVNHSLKSLVDLNNNLTELNPIDFFKESHKNGQARAVFTIGITGSGKSFWCKQAIANNWQIINTDELRKTLLANLKQNNQTLELNGKLESPNPDNPAHIFAPELREKVMDPDFLMEQISQNQPLVLDINNLTLRRTEVIRRLREAGFYIEALVFVPADPHVHNANLELRNSQKGIDIVPTDHPNPKAYRLEVIKSLLGNFESYCQNLKEDPKYTKPKASKPLPKLDFKKLSELSGTRTQIKNQLSNAELNDLETVESEDIFNRVSWTQVGLFVYNLNNKKV
jgi:3'(2'), 5'-bisphosphate nucleotidase